MKRLFPATALAALLLLACACTITTGPAADTSNTNAAASPAQPANTANTANAANTSAADAGNTAAANTSPAASEAGGKQDFTVVNSTGVEINKLFVSPHDKDDWEEDILGRDTLPTGQSVNIKFHRDEPAAMWDLRVEDTQGNAIVWEDLNLLKISKVTLHYDNGRAWADAE